MLVIINDLLSAGDVAKVRESLDALPFVDGQSTAGWHAKLVKDNLQADREHPGYAPLNKFVSSAIMANKTFRSVARPRRITPLLFSRYREGMEYGTHVDDALMYGLRSDVSFTLALADGESYEGGALVMEDPGGARSFKLKAGQMITYASTTLHHVEPVTQGERVSAVGWCQSFVRDAARREILYNLETARRSMFEREGVSSEFELITNSCANLLRMWADS